ncbi:MAG TPA: hypothetical protein VMY77_11815 [Chitinophagaceae bacterium]|nr:hypothetical protein [Chitinophagaceae bacterium]
MLLTEETIKLDRTTVIDAIAYIKHYSGDAVYRMEEWISKNIEDGVDYVTEREFKEFLSTLSNSYLESLLQTMAY